MKKILFTITLLFSFLLVGCSIGKTLTNTPTKQVEIFLNKYQTVDKDVLDDLDAVIANEEQFSGDQRERYREIMKNSYKKLAYQIKDQKEDGNTATVTAEIEVVNFGKILSSANVYLEEHKEELLDENGEYDYKKFIDYRLDEMEKAKEKVKYTIDFKLTKKSEQWVLDDLSKSDEQKIQGIYEY